MKEETSLENRVYSLIGGLIGLATAVPAAMLYVSEERENMNGNLGYDFDTRIKEESQYIINNSIEMLRNVYR